MANIDDFKAPEPGQDHPPASPGTGYTPPTGSEPPQAGGIVEPTQPIVGGAVPPKKRSALRTFIFVLLILVLIVGGALLALQLSKQNETSQDAPSATVKNPIDKLVYAVTEGPLDKLYPNVGTLSVPAEVSLQIFEGLTTYQNKTKIIPLLAESWTNPSDTVWQFKLKKDVKFNTGNPMTAKDVKYTIDLIKSDVKYKDVADAYASSIKSVEAVDDYTVKVTTDKPDANLLTKLVFIGILDSKGKVGDSQSGTGPYTVKKDTTPTEKSIILTAVSNYHGGTVYTKEVEYKVYVSDPEKGQAAALTDLAAKKVNIAQVFDETSIKDAKAQKFELYKTTGQNVTNISFNTLKEGSPVQKLDFRKAVLYGVDINQVVKNSGRSDVVVATDQFVTNDIPGYNKDIKRPARNVTTAKESLKKAGYADGATFSVVVGSASKSLAEDIKKQLAEVGITLNVVIEDNDDTFFNSFLDGKYESWYSAYSPDTLDAEEVFINNFQSPWYGNKTVDSLLKDVGSTFDQSKRLAILQNISKTLYDDVAWLPLFVTQNTWAMDKAYVMNTDLPNSQLGVFFWKVYQK